MSTYIHRLVCLLILVRFSVELFAAETQLTGNSCGAMTTEALFAGGHGTSASLNARYVIPFLGLDKAGAVDPGAGGQRGRPKLNAGHTTFVADNGQPLRGPYTSTKWTEATSYDQIAKIKTLGFNAVHLYGESFDPKYPNPGSTPPGYASNRIDSIVASTRDLGLYLVITIGNGTTYYYVVSALNPAGESADSVQASATPQSHPSLSILQTATNLTLFWPLASTGFTLQMCTNLVSGDWVNVTSPAPEIDGDQWRVVVPVSADDQSVFYRLSK